MGVQCVLYWATRKLLRVCDPHHPCSWAATVLIYPSPGIIFSQKRSALPKIMLLPQGKPLLNTVL